MKSVPILNQLLASICFYRKIVYLAALGSAFIAIPAWGQHYTVQASIDNSCTTHEVKIVVPAGQVARDFTFNKLDAGISCTTRNRIYDKAWGISTDLRRRGNVYYYNENANGRIYSLTDNQTTTLSLKKLVLVAGLYYIHVDGGINATVNVSYRLRPAPGITAASFPAGIVWRFGRVDGSVIAERITLQADGKIQGYYHSNEDHWGLENGKIIFYNRSNQAVTRFNQSAQEGGVTVLRGAFLPNPSITHVLTEVDKVTTPPVVMDNSGPWEYVGIGDCPGNDIAGGGAGNVPNPQVCDSQHAGLAAVCWDSNTPRVMSPPGCTVKSVRAENCTGGVNPGRMYRCAYQDGHSNNPESKAYVNPKINGRNIDNCLYWGADCQKPAADYFCRQQGFLESASFDLVNRRPTWVMGDNKECDGDFCIGFARIVCSRGKMNSTPPIETEHSGMLIGPMEMNTDRMGADIRGFDLQTADPMACQTECVRTPDCTAWTYVKPNTKQGPQPRCWLKHSSPGKNPDTSCISGVIERGK